MRRHKTWVQALTLALCLLLVGTIRSFTPEYLPNESPRRPGRDGVAVTQTMQATLLDSVATRSIHLPLDEEMALTDDVFIVVRVRVEPTQARLFPSYRIDTRDGRSYNPLSTRIASHEGGTVVHSATRATMSFAFELPEAAMTGARLVVHTPAIGRVEPMQAVAEFPLDELEIRDEFTPELDVVEVVTDG